MRKRVVSELEGQVVGASKGSREWEVKQKGREIDGSFMQNVRARVGAEKGGGCRTMTQTMGKQLHQLKSMVCFSPFPKPQNYSYVKFNSL